LPLLLASLKSRTESRTLNPSLAGGQRAAPSAFPDPYRAIRAGKPIGSPCFSPHTNHGERFLGTNLDLCCRRWHPAKTPGVLRIASSVLHILPQTTDAPDSGAPAALVIGRKAAQERFSEESFRITNSNSLHRKRVSQKLYRKFAHNSAELTAHSKPG